MTDHDDDEATANVESDAVGAATFGRYRLLQLLGRGGMGEVWRAFDSDTNREVAVKLLPAHLVADDVFQARFRREAQTAARLNDPHVVPIHHFGEIDGRLYVDMRLIEGRDLAKVLAGGRLPVDRAVAIVEQVGSALKSAHRVGLVHRDVKPSNVLITDDDFAYLIDFGIARGTDDASLTGPGATVGTIAYMAPERFKAGVADARSDVYALACVLFECLTGGPPFPGSSFEEQLAGHLNSDPPRPSTLAPGIPPELDAVIATGMAKDPNIRYPSTTALVDAARAVTAVLPQRSQDSDAAIEPATVEASAAQPATVEAAMAPATVEASAAQPATVEATMAPATVEAELEAATVESGAEEIDESDAVDGAGKDEAAKEEALEDEAKEEALEDEAKEEAHEEEAKEEALEEEALEEEALEEEAESEDLESASKKPPFEWSRIFAYIVLPVLVLVVALAAACLKYVDTSVRDADAAGAQAVRAAKDTTVAILSYKPDTVEKQLTDARGLLTGDFLESYTELTTKLVIPGAKQQQISATANVPQAALVSADLEHAVTLVFVNQTVTIGASPPSETASAVRVTLDKVNGKWLIAKFDPV